MTELETKLEHALIEYVERYGLSERARDALSERQKKLVHIGPPEIDAMPAKEVTSKQSRAAHPQAGPQL